jgi:hypothetical protein
MSALIDKIAKAGAEVGGKLKSDKRNIEQGYNYVSADKILSVCGQALFDQGIAIIPSIVKWDINIIDRGNGKSRYDAVVDLLLKVTDGETTYEEPWFGMGSDYGAPDKALYKAITSGHKYFLAKLFCIGEGNEDGEHETGEDTPQAKPTQVKQAKPPEPAPVVEAPAPDAMSLEDAMNVLNAEGELYGNIPTEKLVIMSNSLRKVLSNGKDLTVDDRAVRERKHQAIGIILAHRAKAQPQ